MAGIFALFGGIAPFALTPLPRIDGYIPAVQAVIACTDFVTAILLFGQYAIARSSSLLVLASGYLFSALIVVAHTLTFPGAFTPTGLLGAGTQTAAWLYVFWHLGFPVAVAGYALLKRHGPHAGSVASAIGWSVSIVVGVVGALTWGTIAWDESLPRLVISETGFSTFTHFITAVTLLVSLLALALLWARGSSMLGWWLMVAVCASIAEAALLTFIAASRYTLAFYSGRVFGVIVSSTLLAALLWAMTRLYARLWLTIRAVQRERAGKLMNLEVMLGAVAHDIKQPLTAIAISADAAQLLLGQPVPDISDMREILMDVKRDSLRASEVFDNIRALCRNPDQGRQQIDLNELAIESLELLSAELKDHEIRVSTELAPGLPLIAGHKGQLREVLVNIIQNAIDAMHNVTDRSRTLRVKTDFRDRDRIEISIEDSGCGIEPQRLGTLFESC